MNPELTKVFAYDETMIRVLGTPDAPLFVNKDSCQAMGIEHHRDAFTRIPEDERAYAQTDSLGGPQTMACLTEAGLYRLIFRSDKPEAKRFQDWVFKEVLPSLRKTGTYSLNEKLWDAYDKAKTGRVQLEILRLLNVQVPEVSRPSATGDVNVTKFFEDLISAWQAGDVSNEYFRVDEEFLQSPPGTQGQGPWDSVTLSFDPHKVIDAMCLHFLKTGRTLVISLKDLRDHFARFDFWGAQNMRLGKAGQMATVLAWRIKLDCIRWVISRARPPLTRILNPIPLNPTRVRVHCSF